MHRIPRAVTLACMLALIVPACLTGCSGDSAAPDASPKALETQLETARKTLDTATSLDFSLSTPKLPSGVTGLLEATGQGTHAPAFKGKVKVSARGITLSADVVAVGGIVYAKTGFSPKFVPVDPSSLGAPDPAALMDRHTGVSSLLSATTGLESGKKSRDGSDVLTSITGVLRGKAVQSLIPSADKSADFKATYRLTDDDVLRDATLTGPFYPGGDTVSYTLEITASDKSVDISAP